MTILKELLSFLLVLACTHVAHATPCSEGRLEGYKTANNTFVSNYNGCDDVFEFAKEADNLLDVFRGGGVENKKFNRCARKGVKKFVKKLYKRCLDPVECDKYGVLAADLVITDFCQTPSNNRIYEPGAIKKNCKKNARIKCKGSLYSSLETFIESGYSCDAINDNLDEFATYKDELRDNCTDSVKSLMQT